MTLIKVGNIILSPHHHDTSGLDRLSLFGVLKKDANRTSSLGILNDVCFHAIIV